MIDQDIQWLAHDNKGERQSREHKLLHCIKSSSHYKESTNRTHSHPSNMPVTALLYGVIDMSFMFRMWAGLVVASHGGRGGHGGAAAWHVGRSEGGGCGGRLRRRRRRGAAGGGCGAAHEHGDTARRILRRDGRPGLC